LNEPHSSEKERAVSVDLNGIALIQLTVIDPAGVLFREKLCHFLAMKTLVKGDGVVYCIGSRTGIPVRADEEGGAAAGSTSAARGLHHLCCRARARADVDVIHRFLIDEVGARIVHPPEDAPHFAPGYYSVLFEDPDGIRVEVNHVGVILINGLTRLAG
jgi:catechol 2,3-dioxygenase-like lactoylglutathione lyase family enzyme